MSLDWPLVVLALGLVANAVAFYALRSRDTAHEMKVEVASLRHGLDARAADVLDVNTRVKRIEQALKLDGQRITAEAARAALPPMMR